jgi:hypothetical protein
VHDDDYRLRRPSVSGCPIRRVERHLPAWRCVLPTGASLPHPRIGSTWGGPELDVGVAEVLHDQRPFIRAELALRTSNDQLRRESDLVDPQVVENGALMAEPRR